MEGRSRKIAANRHLGEGIESRDSNGRMERNSLGVVGGRRPLSLSVFKPVSGQLIERQDAFVRSIYPKLWV